MPNDLFKAYREQVLTIHLLLISILLINKSLIQQFNRMKRSDFIKLSAMSSIIIPQSLIGKSTEQDKEQIKPEAKPLFCTTCGTQFVDTKLTSGNCPVCSNDRQHIPAKGQAWTKMEDLQNTYSNLIIRLSDTLYEIKTLPKFAIGQKAFLILSPNGNILWDCISLLNEATIEFIKSKGGLKAIVVSHPHFYSSINDWAETFNCPIYIHQNDEEFIYTKGSRVTLWKGAEKELWDGIIIKNIGGHFPGSSILIVPFLSAKGTIFCSDTFFISPNKKHVSVMYSYPNFIPVSLSEIKRINESMINISFDTLIGALENQKISPNAKEILHASFLKYI
jgi:glyoxylase-like metal-dependent hydrolase (beta-lactamase superfamily II)